MDISQYYMPNDRGPLDQPTTMPRTLNEETKVLAAELAGIDRDIMEAKKHIVTVLKAESGANNIKLLSEALVNIEGLVRRKT